MSYTRSMALGVVIIALGAGSPGRTDDVPKKDEKLRAELIHRADDDQKARKQLIDLQARRGGKDEVAEKEVAAATKKVQEIDARNTAWMKEAVNKHGWPGKSLVGTDGSQKAWLLVQHADQDRAFQKRCLKLLAEAVKKGEASPEHLAFLTDRLRVADKEKQVYGTQFHEVGGKMEPYPIEDETDVDKRRKEVGLPPLAEYRKMIEELYKPRKPTIKKLGTIDLLMVETTPVVFKDRLYRFEYVRDNYHANKTGASHFRFIDVANGKATPAFAKGQHLGCAFVDGDTVYAYGVDKWGGSKVTGFRSKDLEKWEEKPALHLPGWELFNTSVCKADGRYVMAVEVGGPKDVVGVPFTVFFAESKDLLTWKLLPRECVYSKEKYTACPALRYLDGYFYMLYLEARPGPAYETHVVRSKDLKRWESSRLNPVMSFSDEDKEIANPKLTTEQRKAIAGAKNVNNSDVDLCEFKGKTIIYYSWGNQQGKEFLAEAVYEGTLADFLRGFFP